MAASFLQAFPLETLFLTTLPTESIIYNQLKMSLTAHCRQSPQRNTLCGAGQQGCSRSFQSRFPRALLTEGQPTDFKINTMTYSRPPCVPSRRTVNVICMANSRRMARVSKQIEREIGALFVSDKVVQAAICPERRRGIDDGLSALASVTEVEVSNDLQVAKVYLSIYSDESGKAAAMRGLQKIEGYVRKHIGRQIRLRLTPEIRFILDDSIERSERVLSLLKQVEKIRTGDAPPPPVSLPSYDDEDDFDLFYEDEDGDQGIISSVDLGFYDEEDDDTVASSQTLQSRGDATTNEKDGSIALSDDDVEEMLSFFKQDASAVRGTQKNRKKSPFARKNRL